MNKWIIGVDIGGTTTKIGLFDLKGNLAEKWIITTRTENKGEGILEDIKVSILNKLNGVGINRVNVEGIGFGVPGPVLKDGTVVRCVNLGWDVINVKKEFEELAGIPTKVGNDANIAALGEMWQGSGKGYQNIVMLTLGTGVGGGIVVNGNIVPGLHGAAGEIGHIQVNDKEEAFCNCGGKGCLEQYASATAVARNASKYFEDHDTSSSVLNNHKVITAKDICDAARNGDHIAEKILENAAEQLGKAMAHIAKVIDPEIFLIGGGMSYAGQILLEKIEKYYKKYAFHASYDSKILQAALGNDAGIYGAAKLAVL